MDKNEKIAVAIVIAGIVVFNVYSNGKVKNEIRLLQNEISNMNSSFENDFNGLNYNIEELKENLKVQLEKERSILSSNNYDIAYEDGRMKIKLSAVPKEFNGEETVKFIVEGEEFLASNEGGAFVATCSIAPTEKVEARVQFIKGDNMRQEELPVLDVLEELAIYPNVIWGNGFYLEDKNEEYRETVFLTFYNGNKKVELMNPREITLLIKDRNTKKTIKEIPMESASSDIRNLENLKFMDGETLIYTADLRDVVKVEGQYGIDCNLVTENGLRYIFEVGEFTINKEGSNSQWGTMSGVAYPSFD